MHHSHKQNSPQTVFSSYYMGGATIPGWGREEVEGEVWDPQDGAVVCQELTCEPVDLSPHTLLSFSFYRLLSKYLQYIILPRASKPFFPNGVLACCTVYFNHSLRPLLVFRDLSWGPKSRVESLYMTFQPVSYPYPILLVFLDIQLYIY
jgi:hypothetical protein